MSRRQRKIKSESREENSEGREEDSKGGEELTGESSLAAAFPEGVWAQ